ncbi:hypothetical protein QE210_19345 (plasmid) [Arsenophonus nasoniae]|uniref:Transglutaminase-like domain-containing protein n=2 Tax=Arsenophonus nasoniae TaxID=638 RepID=A0AA95K8F7_9GAMM|nr:hypothetical protein QE210_19345 [Arsenophonus nasoniae]
MCGNIKFIEKWFTLVFPVFCFFVISGFLFCFSYFLLFGQLYDYDNNKKDFFSRYANTTPRSFYDNQYLTHRLINMDFTYGITNKENFDKALRNVNRFLEEVNTHCIYQRSDEGTANYLNCANKVLHDNFYYTPSLEVSNNYAINRSDCDTNTYLMMDAMKLKGIESFIVYAPGHAFLAWKDKFGNFNYRETTSNNNTGEVADLTKSSLYQKAFDKSLYTPMSAEQAEKVYHSLIYDKSGGRVDIDALYKENKNNAFVSDQYFDVKNKQDKIRKLDVEYLLSLLNTDFTSTTKKMIVVNYFINNNQPDQATKILSTIPLDDCERDCFLASVTLNKLNFIPFKVPFLLYDDYLKSHGSNAKVQSFYWGILFLGITLISIIVTLVFLIKLLKEMRKITSH